jgi:Fe-S cluster assembly ATP-binding protein
MLLEVKNLSVEINEQEILHDLDLKLEAGTLHVVMGPNGAGKSTLSNVLLGHPNFKVSAGKILFTDQDITNLSPEERAILGLFMSWQQPPEIEGVALDQFLFLAYKNIFSARDKNWQAPSVFEFSELLKKQAEILKIKPELLKRSLNVGFSGGEKKKIEMLQLSLFQPRLAILDETDSGLDIDALKIVAESIKIYHQNKGTVLLITHYPEILEFLKPDFVHVMVKGQIVSSGGEELVNIIKQTGFSSFLK